LASITPARTTEVFKVRHFHALRGRVRDDFWERNEPVMHRCMGQTLLEGDRVLACWGWIGEEPWVAIPNDLTPGQLRYVLKIGREWRDLWDWAFTLASVREDDLVARRFAEFMGFREFDRPSPGVVRYERIEG
jgi:hypothetical protein